MRYFAVFGLAALGSVAAHGQQIAEPAGAPRYERVVITTHPPDDQTRARVSVDSRGRLVAANVTLRALAVKAFGVPPERIAGGPEWIDTEAFDVIADPPEGARNVDVDAMVRLLEEHFALQARWELHRMPVYLLKRQKGNARLGRRIRPPAPGCEQTGPRVSSLDCDGGAGWKGVGWLFVRRGPVRTLATFLSSEVGREVLDETGLKGTYDIDLTFAPASMSPNPATGSSDVMSRPDVFTAIREQLGLELEPSSAERPVHWIIHAERPPEH